MAATTFDIAVIGGGIAGLTAAHHAALAGVSVACFQEGDLLGGLVANVGDVEGFPATGRVSGTELATALADANGRLGVELIRQRVGDLRLEGSQKLLAAADGKTYRAGQVIVATGARLRGLGVPGEQELAYRGVSQCAWCDGGLFRGQEVVVVGGGDSALSEALHLASFASAITVVTRGDGFRARQSYVSRAADDERFQFRWQTDVVEILGADGVEGVRLCDHATGAVDELPCRGVFVFVGLEPNGEFLGAAVERDAAGFVVTDAMLETATPGLFAVGAVRSGYLGRLTNAVGEATVAAIAATRRLAP